MLAVCAWPPIAGEGLPLGPRPGSGTGSTASPLTAMLTDLGVGGAYLHGLSQGL